MIVDHIDNLGRYHVPKAKAIQDFIATHDCLSLPNGEMEIEGRNLFVRVMEYEPKPAAENSFEAHRVHADLQYVVSGVELMQYTDPKGLVLSVPYDAKVDFQFFKTPNDMTDVVVKQGWFTVFYPGEPHRPSCLYQNNKAKVKKIVFKIKMN